MKTTKSTCKPIVAILLSASIIFAIGALLFLKPQDKIVMADNSSVELAYTLHEEGDNSGYYPTSSNQVKKLSPGLSRLGTLTVSGGKVTTWNGYQAVAVDESNICFAYKQKANTGWILSSDTATTANGYNLNAPIGNGALLVLKSFDGGKTYSYETSVLKIDNQTVKFQPSAADVKRGVVYKFINCVEQYYTYKYVSSYKTVYPDYWDAPWELHVFGGPAAVGIWILANGKDEPVYSVGYDYQNFMQVSTVYVASNNLFGVGFYSAETDEVEIDKEKVNDVTVEEMAILKKGFSLQDGSVSYSPVRVDFNGNKSFNVKVSFNGSDPFTVDDGRTFKNPGHYKFTVTSSFGSSREVNIWIVDLRDDLMYSQYFGENFIDQSKRMLDLEIGIPKYLIGTTIHITPENPYLPPVFGSVEYFETATDIENGDSTTIVEFNGLKTNWSQELLQPGIYYADITIGNPSVTGSIPHYSFYWYVSADIEYRPFVNEGLLRADHRASSLITKIYTTKFTTAGGGSYLFSWPATAESYQEALAFAEAIELRFVEEYEEENQTVWYYRSSNRVEKQRFLSKIDLFIEISKNAKANVEIAYIIPDGQYACMNQEEALENIEKTSIPQDIRVCLSPEIKSLLTTAQTEVYLNGFAFTQMASYEVEKVELISENGECFEVPFDTDISSILSESGVYKVVEYNWNSTNEYEAIFIAEGENFTEVTFEKFYNYQTDTQVITQQTEGEITANSIKLIEGVDRFDSQSLILIDDESSRTAMHVSEFKDYVLDKPGEYTLTFINRLGYKYTVKINIEPIPKTTVNFEGVDIPAIEVEYGSDPSVLPVAEKYGYTFNGWIDCDTLEPVEASTFTKAIVNIKPIFNPIEVTVVYSYLSKIKSEKVAFGTEFSLPDAPAGGSLQFSHWVTADGQIVEGLWKIDSLDPVYFVAVYDEIEKEVDLPEEEVENTPEEGSKDQNQLINNNNHETVPAPEKQTKQQTVEESVEQPQAENVQPLKTTQIEDSNQSNYRTITISLIIAGSILFVGVICWAIIKKIRNC